MNVFMQRSITRTFVRTFICISMQMSKRRQHRHISALLLPLPPPCGEYAASVADFVCAGIAVAAVAVSVVVSFLGLAFYAHL